MYLNDAIIYVLYVGECGRNNQIRFLKSKSCMEFVALKFSAYKWS